MCASKEVVYRMNRQAEAFIPFCHALVVAHAVPFVIAVALLVAGLLGAL